LVVKDLNPDTTYIFYLSALNAVGASQPIKFRVTTPRKFVSTEQRDFPVRAIDNSQQVKSGSDNKKEVMTKPPIVDESNVLIETSWITDNGSAILGLIVGLLLVVIAVVVAVLCGVMLRKRRQHSKYKPSSQRMAKPSRSQPDQSLIQLQTCQTIDRLPDVALTDESTLPVHDIHISYGSLNRNYHSRVTSPCDHSRVTAPCDTLTRLPSIQRSGTSSFMPTTQQKEWDRMLMNDTLCHNDVMTMSLSSDIVPHDFMHDTTVTCIQSPGTLRKPYRQRTKSSVKQLFSQDTQDGYVSADNVDDDIDKVDFTIRMPSVHNKLCEL